MPSTLACIIKQVYPPDRVPAPTSEVLGLSSGAGRLARPGRVRAVAGGDDQGAVVAHNDLLAAGLNHLRVTLDRQALGLCGRGSRMGGVEGSRRRWRAGAGGARPLDRALRIVPWHLKRRQACRRLSHPKDIGRHRPRAAAHLPGQQRRDEAAPVPQQRGIGCPRAAGRRRKCGAQRSSRWPVPWQDKVCSEAGNEMQVRRRA